MTFYLPLYNLYRRNSFVEIKNMRGFPKGEAVASAYLARTSGLSPTSSETDICTRYTSIVGPDFRANSTLTLTEMENLVAIVLNQTLTASLIPSVTNNAWGRSKTMEVLAAMARIGQDGEDIVMRSRDAHCETKRSLCAASASEMNMPQATGQVSIGWKGNDVVITSAIGVPADHYKVYDRS